MKGFTLIETLVAITILTLSVAGPLYTANRAIVAAETSRDQLVASYLAQEGVEYVRRVRDDTYLAAYSAGGPNVSDIAWQDFLDASPAAVCRSPQVCTLDPVESDGPPLSSCPGNVCTAPLYLLANALYSQQQNLPDSQETPFVRSIEIRDVPGTDDEKEVVSSVMWSFHGSAYSVVIVDNLTPWQ